MRPLLCALALLLMLPATAAAQAVGELEAIRVADRDPKVVGEREEHGGLSSSASVEDDNWEVAYFADGKEVALAIVRHEMGIMAVSCGVILFLGLRAAGTSGAF